MYRVTPGSLRSPGAGGCYARFTGADRVARRSRRTRSTLRGENGQVGGACFMGGGSGGEQPNGADDGDGIHGVVGDDVDAGVEHVGG